MRGHEVEHISKYINPNTCGIVWLTDDYLDLQTPGAYEINYLLNGVITKSLAKDSVSLKHTHNFFLGENFGKPFFVAHTKVSDTEDLSKFYSTVNLAKNILKENSEVYIFNRSKNTANINILKVLRKTYPHIVFEHLNL